MQSQRFVKMAFNKFRVKLKTMGVVVNGRSSGGAQGAAPLFWISKRKLQQDEKPPGQANPPPPKLKVWIRRCQQTKKQRNMIGICCTNFH